MKNQNQLSNHRIKSNDFFIFALAAHGIVPKGA